ncbi:MAG: transketolase C-terminal domain-containing protein, partial [Planctomycetota bacterium]
VAVAAAEKLRDEGLNVTVVNPRFVKPIDIDTLGPLMDEAPFVLTAEENVITGGFGSALLEAANARGVRTDHVRVLALPDEFVEHGPRDEILSDFGLDADGLRNTALSLDARSVPV